jgi:dihydroneopterin aldolase
MSASSIEIRGLQALGRHGVLPEEQARAQPFEVDITIETHIAPAARTDHLDATVDYSTVIAAVVELVETTQFALLESLASAIAEEVLGRRGVEAVTVEVRKMRPPVPAQVAWVGVRLRRTSV